MIGDFMLDAEGRPLPYSPAQVRAMLKRLVETGQILAVIAADEHGNLVCQVFGPPTRDVLEVLEVTARGFRNILDRGHA